MSYSRRNFKGFTIVELLIVIVVIAILAAITIVAYNGIQTRAQDSKRTQDLNSIKKSLLAYDAMYGGVPQTAVYGSSGVGGWDNSTRANWLNFLVASSGSIPRDPVNTIDNTNANGDYPGDPGERVYFYYCYPSSSLVETGKPTVSLGYRAALTDTIVRTNFIVQSCLTSLP